MMKLSTLALSAFALAACGQAANVEPAPEAPVEVAQSTGGACTEVPALIDTVGFESQGSVAGHTILSDPGTVACSEPALDSVECAITGPTAIRVETGPTSFVNYTLAAGQSGTLTVGPSGSACHLNANGG
ncbi:hypothetical protein U91I_00786 [alpha proteobacterium U9-1i]|nr:hypothetical protein U91I_00786 [alpha proteobacterium U9-1i]